ncbi:alpha/beta hydrolase family protein [Flavobacterium geliluteum]|uniref:Alpha/beta fold hydrolase n=1 Tax=Flavobacterium geliluteum TaxID=2816120 RepID=A0A940XGQ2_9FLAO|nr:alpha/beta fold hydrolase [Flavobacterium geliluteum]MBP4139475.1 alpha/beta fold hydrolase [Flavobacterium geliluteum]
MKTKILTLMLLSILFIFAQEITGSWQGELDVQGMKLPLIIHIKKDGNKLVSSLESPKQGVTNIPISTISFIENQLLFDATSLGLSYSGKYNNETIDGIFKQGGMEIPLIFTKLKDGETTNKIKRPQTPKAPFNYVTEEISFVNPTDKNTLAGTISEPKNFDKKRPILVMITGSGRQNRDEELFEHKPFAVIADDFAKKGIATLRMDDRGIGGSSQGSKSETTYNYATDISAAVDFMIKKGYQNIGLIGHSEGGMIAPIVASLNKKVSFMVLMAGPGTPIDELLAKQIFLSSKLMGMKEENLQKELQSNQKTFAFIKNYAGNDYEKDLKNFLTKEGEEINEDNMKQLKNTWFRYFISFNPDKYVSQIKIPVLAINGSLDFQVPAKDNLAAIEKSLKKAKNKNFETYEFEGMNHLFQECKTGALAEYAEIEQTISPKVLDKMSTWILDK